MRPVQRRTSLAALALLVCLGTGRPATAAAPLARWQVEPSDFVHYEVVESETEDSDRPGVTEDTRGHPTNLHGFYGYEIADGLRLVRPVGHVEWLHLPFALRLPEKRVTARLQIEIDERLEGTWRLAALRARGRMGVSEIRMRDGHPEVELSGLVLLSPTGAGPGDAPSYYRLRQGRCSWKTTFDLERGLATRIEYELSAQTGWTNAPAPRAVNQLRPGDRTYRARAVLQLDRRYEHRYSGFTGAVDRAILASTRNVLTYQMEDGSFRGTGPFGTTGLALLALVRGGLPPDHPDVARGFAWLLAQEPRGIYETSAAIMAVEALGTPEEEMRRARRGELDAPLPRELTAEARAFVQRGTDYVLENVMEAQEEGRTTTGTTPLRWGYPHGYEIDLEPDIPDWWDNSNTQYAVLGLNAAVRCGVEVPPAIWAGVAEHYLSVQAVEGRERGDLRLASHERGRAPGGRRYAPQGIAAVERGWAYRDCPIGSRTYGSMTAAGISSLVIADAQLAGGGRARRHRVLSRRIADAVRDGWAALDGMWTVFENPLYEGWYVYHLYGLERAGILSDVESLGGHDWYWEGAMQLVLRQKESGAWPTYSSEPLDTIWALLFLSRSTTPITPR